jgi:methionyl-tRNA synthetase
VHGFWNVDDRKVSKSLGNMVSPLAMRERYGFEAFRYFLLREMSFGLDADFREEALVERVNADLANNLGNLVARTLNLVEKLFAGTVPEPARPEPFFELFRKLGEPPIERVERAVAELQLHVALAAVFEYASGVNQYLDGAAPWKLAKRPEGRASAATVLYNACEALRVTALLLAPFLPETAQRIAERLGVPDLLAQARLPQAAAWGQLVRGTPIAKGESLFPRIEAVAETDLA